MVDLVLAKNELSVFLEKLKEGYKAIPIKVEFYRDLVLKYIDRELYALDEPFLFSIKFKVYHPKLGIESIPRTIYYAIPAGFKTDLASIPRCFWWFIAPWDRCAKPAVIHDYFYRTKELSYITRELADKTFTLAMFTAKTSKFRLYPAYWAVRLFGKPFYQPRKNFDFNKLYDLHSKMLDYYKNLK